MFKYLHLKRFASICTAALALGVVLAVPAAAQTVEVQNGTTVEVQNGGVIDLEGGTMDFGDVGTTARLDEQGGGHVTGGQLEATRVLSSPSGADPAGLGAEISASADLGDVSIVRGHTVQGLPDNNESIRRFYDIEPSGTNSGLDATFTFHYVDAELNGLSESTLQFFKSTDGGSTWSNEGAESRDASANTATLNDIGAFSRWTLGGGEGGGVDQPSRIPTNITRSFGDANEPGDYRLVALPGEVNVPLGQTLVGEAGAQWQAFWDDGSAEDFLVQFDGSETFNFQTGRGFWVTATEDWSVEDSIETVSLGSDQAAAIPLNGESSWTIVSNPLSKDVSWATVQAENDLDQPLWHFDDEEGFVQFDTMRSARTGTAYYLFNAAGHDSLRIPYPTGSSSSLDTKSTPASEASLLAITAQPTGTDGPSSTVRLGMADDEGHSLVAPPGRFEPVSLRIEAAGPAESGRTRFRIAETRPLERSSQRQGRTFGLHLTRRVEGPVQIQAGNVTALDGHEAALLHPSAGTTHDLRAEESVTIDPEGSSAELKVAVGTEAYVKDKASEVRPDKVTLTSYPNPVQKQATLSYALTEATDVRVSVYDVLGRRVATLVNERHDAGRYEVQLKADRLPSGVYFGRLRAGDQTRIQKLTVVR